MADASHSASYCAIAWSDFAADHPALPGHFPNRPVVPGVLLLAHVHALLDEYLDGYRLSGLPVVKFLQPVLPETSLLLGIEVRALNQHEAQGRFILRNEHQLVAQGSFVAEARP